MLGCREEAAAGPFLPWQEGGTRFQGTAQPECVAAHMMMARCWYTAPLAGFHVPVKPCASTSFLWAF